MRNSAQTIPRAPLRAAFIFFATRYLLPATRYLLPATCFLLSPQYSSADAPSVAYIFPAGGQRGTKVDFHVGGHYLRDACPFEMIGPGVDAGAQLVRAEKTLWFEGPVIPLPDSQAKEDYPVDNKGSVSIAVNAPLGFRRWRVWTSQGVTESMKFVVGDLPEIVEQEIDGDPIPTAVSLPITINGRMFPREDVDIWTFQAKAGTAYTCEVMANRLGSPLDSRLAVYGPEKRLVAENIDGRGADSFLRFTAKQDGVYQVHIHDVNFSGLQQYVYRLTITDGARVDAVYPLGGRRGSTTKFQLLGQGVPRQPVLLSLPDTPDLVVNEVIRLNGQDTNPFAIELSDLPEYLETEPNDDAANASTVPVGSVVNGCIRVAHDVDSWWFDAKQGESVELDLRASRLGSLLDSVMSVLDETGKELATNDDVKDGQPDSGLKFKAPADGRYRVVVRERFGSWSGEQFAFRLYITHSSDPQADFQLQLPRDALTVARGSAAKLKVAATRVGGFQDEIALEVEGLPAGIEVSNNTIKAKKNDTQLTLKATADAKIDVSRVRIAGSAKIGETVVKRTASKAADTHDDLGFDYLTLAVAFPTPFKVTGEFETRYAARGSTYLRHYTIDRGGYQGPLTVRMAERQVRHLQGVTGGTVIVPAGESEFDYAIKLPPWMEIGRTSRTAVMAAADIADTDGRTHRVSYTSHEQNDQVIVLVDPGQLDVRLDHKSMTASPGAERSLKVTVGRGQGITGPVGVELILPEHCQGLSARKLEIPADIDHGTLQLHFAENGLGPWNMPLAVRATAMRDGLPYTAEAKLSVVPDRAVAQGAVVAATEK